jgi:hypothetical protein
MPDKKLVAIYNVWDDWEILFYSINNIRKLVDGVIVVYSTQSNSGEKSYIPQNWLSSDLLICEPDLKKSLRENETFKRNAGLKKAKELGYTHFLMMDADEFYEPAEFLKEKERIFKNDLAGTVCRTKVYFREPTLTVGYDVTLVPFIHKITPDLCFMWNTRYPFAFEGPKRHIRIDPTRQMNITSGVEWSEITMHHMSWVRSDIKKKIRNSTARQNIENSTIVRDYTNSKAGYYCEFYKAKIESCENLFNIPRIVDESISSELS